MTSQILSISIDLTQTFVPFFDNFQILDFYNFGTRNDVKKQ